MYSDSIPTTMATYVARLQYVMPDTTLFDILRRAFVCGFPFFLRDIRPDELAKGAAGVFDDVASVDANVSGALASRRRRSAFPS